MIALLVPLLWVVHVSIRALEDATAQGVTDSHQLQQVVRRTIGPWVGRKIRRRPMIIPTVIEA
ncbi:hypothetical protein LG324_09535 [Phycicoccus jejuensis]